MRLIDADALMKELDREVELADDWKTAHEIVNVVKYFPTIEPQRMRGRWIEDGYNDEKAVCDQCGEPCATYIMGEPRDKYCKWCGAEMRRTE